MDEQWWSIEVLDGEFSREREERGTSPAVAGNRITAAVWQESHRTALVEALLTNGGIDWAWQRRPWGIVLEVRFADEDAWQSFRALPAVRAALDAVPDPVGGLLIYRGRGGSSGATAPRHPRPHLGAGAASVPEEPAPVVVAGHPDPERVPPPFVPAA